jgi:hypothetical protein
MEPFILEDGSRLYIFVSDISVMYVQQYEDGHSECVIEAADG